MHTRAELRTPDTDHGEPHNLLTCGAAALGFSGMERVAQEDPLLDQPGPDLDLGTKPSESGTRGPESNNTVALAMSTRNVTQGPSLGRPPCVDDQMGEEASLGSNDRHRGGVESAHPRWSGATISSRRKLVLGLPIVLGIAVSWVGSTQTAKSTYSAHFNAPFCTVWFTTLWMIVCFPLYLAARLLIAKETLHTIWRCVDRVWHIVQFHDRTTNNAPSKI